MHRADLITACVLIVFGTGVVAESLRMPRFENLGVDPYTAPGVVPGALGLSFIVFGLVMLVRTMRARAAVDAAARAASPAVARGGARRLLISLALMLGFGAILVGLIPFWLATFLFVTAFILIFEGWDEGRRVRVARTATIAVVEGAVVAAAVTFVFERIFLVRLP